MATWTPKGGVADEERLEFGETSGLTTALGGDGSPASITRTLLMTPITDINNVLDAAKEVATTSGWTFRVRPTDHPMNARAVRYENGSELSLTLDASASPPRLIIILTHR